MEGQPVRCAHWLKGVQVGCVESPRFKFWLQSVFQEEKKKEKNALPVST